MKDLANTERKLSSRLSTEGAKEMEFSGAHIARDLARLDCNLVCE